MRTTIVLDDKLMEAARDHTGVEEKSTLVRLTLKRLVESEAARRLALLGGREPDIAMPPRRRFGTG
ncbi:MAG: type II toxin-antitoxin system VapB family antitoxin [Rhodospirillales bacterium]